MFHVPKFLSSLVLKFLVSSSLYFQFVPTARKKHDMAVASITRKLLNFILIYSFLPTTYGALDHYISALGERGNANRDELIETYFHLGLQQIEIVAFLTLAHCITISLRQLKRVLQRKGLRRRGANSSLDLVIRTIQQEIEGSGK